MTTRREIIRTGLGLAGIIAAGQAPAAIVRSIVGAAGTKYLEDGSGLPDNPTAADYIQDGLLAMYDAIENGGFGVHEDNPQFWRSCVGDGTLNASTSWYPTASKNGQFIDDGFWCSPDANKSAFPTKVTGQKQVEVCCILRDGLTQGVWLPTGYLRDLRIVTCLSETYGMYIPLGLNAGKKVVFPPVAEKTTISVKTGVGYINGYEDTTVLSESLAGWGISYSYNDVGLIGAVSGAAQKYMPEAIFCLRAYNRELTPKEIRYNYLIDQMRFGLPTT